MEMTPQGDLDPVILMQDPDYGHGQRHGVFIED